MTLAFIEVGSFILRFVGTCAVFYPFFLCRTIGAGDIKLMGVVTGFLGVWDGMLVIGLGMVFAAAAASKGAELRVFCVSMCTSFP